MVPETTFEQKRSQFRTRITLEDAGLTSYFEDQQHASTIRLEYEELPFDTREHVEKMQPARAAAIFLGFMALFQLANYYLGGSFMAAPPSVAVFQLALAGLFEFGFRKTKTAFQVFDSYKGSVYVIRDGKCEDIVSELSERRNAQIRERHGAVNLLAEPERERDRFQYLLEHGVISQERYAEAMDEIDGGDPASLPSPTQMPPSGTLH